MGLFSSIGKAIKKALKFTTRIANPLLKPLKGLWDTVTGKTAQQNMAQAQEAQLKAQQESSKLNAANEIDNVVRIEGQDINDTVDPTRRKKRPVGSYASGIGLQV